MDAMDKSDEEGILKCKEKVDRMYNNEIFPIHVEKKEKQWYVELSKRPSANNPIEQVHYTPFK